jgi:ATP-dependent helicase HrpA
LSRAEAPKADDAARTAYTQALAQSIAACEARAAAVPTPSFDESLPVSREAERIVGIDSCAPGDRARRRNRQGKTTQLPKLCLAAGRGAAGLIGCTQPRRIAARAVARRVAQELQSNSAARSATRCASTMRP